MGVSEPVRSAANPRLKAVRGLRAGKDRDHLLLEGDHLLEEALAAGARLDWVLYAEGEESDGRAALLERARAKGIETVPCERQLMREVSDLSTPAGLLGFGPRPATSATEVFAAAAGGLVVVAAGIQDPGNLGAMVRSAAGLGAAAVIAVRGGVSLWHPRALRGASGTTFRLPVADRVRPDELVESARSSGFPLWEAAAGGKPVSDCPRGAVALLLGEEGAGLAPELAQACDGRVGIPLSRGVESLNVAAATAVLVHALLEER